MTDRTLSLFEAFGVEIEYMIVDAATLDVAPAADWLLAQEGGPEACDVERGAFAWSNELVLHLIEVKTNGPKPLLAGLADGFQEELRVIGSYLAAPGLQLLPTGMHPWMDPGSEVQLWPYEHNEIYAAFDRIFDCRGHGWANLQSVHLNLPFANDEDFARLHAAVRAVLPLLPGIAASSPFVDGKETGLADNRLRAYEKNCQRIPSITGAVIPEPVFSMQAYREQLLGKLYADIAAHDPDGTLQEEWLNARGAIARFDRMAIEIRLLDVQECPRADLAVLEVIAATLGSLADETWSSLATQQALEVVPLKHCLDRCVAAAERAVIDDRKLLRSLGWNRTSEAPAARLWEHLVETAAARSALSADAETALQHYLRHGTLASRLLRRVPHADRRSLDAVYRDLVRCLANGTLFA